MPSPCWRCWRRRQVCPAAEPGLNNRRVTTSRRTLARRRGLQALLADEEVWAGRQLGAELPASLTPIPPLTLSLPVPARRDTLGLLFADPVWQLA